MAKEEFRYYMNFRNVVHRRAESWFDTKGSEGEQVYSKSYTRVKGMNDITPYESQKPKSKSKSRKKNGSSGTN